MKTVSLFLEHYNRYRQRTDVLFLPVFVTNILKVYILKSGINNQKKLQGNITLQSEGSIRSYHGIG